ncbi:Mce family protein [Gordonia effusa NBRC 100432]|uniref:Mce family protein n=1 Tax=Gordonia effusa NBRC 100432 TaxID=1077974 RepID=H0R4X2_9ACTN|nr:MlaD family protein [Gordonia effusa]GAB20123.1 Mce family protein [Gordonia effusa NBRC 100432]
MRSKILLSSIAMVTLALCGVVYLTLGVFEYRPTQRSFNLTVELPNSGGLMETSPVTINGLQIGKVTSLKEGSGNVIAELEVDAAYQIPLDSEISVANLSAVGEQYINFGPRTTKGPFYSDGAKIAANRVTRPITITGALNGLNDMFDQVYPEDINNILKGASDSVAGVQPNIARMVRAASLFATTVRQNKELVGRALSLIAGATTESDRGPELAKEAAQRLAAMFLPEIPGIIDDAIQIVDSSRGVKIIPYHDMVHRIIGYIELLVADVAPILDIIQPILLDPIHTIKIDVNKAMDAMLAAFPNGKGMRLLINIPR